MDELEMYLTNYGDILERDEKKGINEFGRVFAELKKTYQDNKEKQPKEGEPYRYKLEDFTKMMFDPIEKKDKKDKDLI